MPSFARLFVDRWSKIKYPLLDVHRAVAEVTALQDWPLLEARYMTVS